MAIYAVRCNFTEPTLEDEFNDWYINEHSDKLLALPGFRAATRYRAVGLDDSVRYLTIWTLDRPDALESAEYRAARGGTWPQRYEAHIADWSRTVYEEIAHRDAEG
jgi:hypothetical protein